MRLRDGDLIIDYVKIVFTNVDFIDVIVLLDILLSHAAFCTNQHARLVLG